MKKLYNKIKYLIVKHKKISVVTALLIVAIVSSGIFLYKKYTAPLAFLTSLTDQQQVALGRVIGDAYQNIYGYKVVCKTENITLQKYPEKYKEHMKNKLETLNKILSKDGLNLEAAIYLFLQQEELHIINTALYNEMRHIADSDEEGIKSSCILFEEQADTVAFGMAKISEQKYDKIFYSILK